MKFKDSKYFKGALSIGVGAVLLTTAVFANYESASGYNVCKEALKKAAFAENYSFDMVADITIDGETYVKYSNATKLNVGGNPCYSSETTGTEPNGDIYFSKSVQQDDCRIYQYTNDAAELDHGYITPGYNGRTSFAESLTGKPETGEKMINFAETVADTFVGDLKNSFVLASSEDGIRKYTINLSREQMPSYVSSGMSLMASIIQDDNAHMDDDDPSLKVFGSGDPYVQDAGLTISVAEDNSYMQMVGNLNFIGYDRNGAEHSLTIDISVELYDFGTTSIERVSDEVIAGLEDYRSMEKRYNVDTSEVVDVTVNDDGATIWVDTESIELTAEEAKELSMSGGADPRSVMINYSEN